MNIESIFKFLMLNTTIDGLNLSNSNLDTKKIYKLTKALVKKEFEISKLDLSRNPSIKDKDCVTLKNLFSKKTSVQYLYLDETPITEVGVESIM